MKNNFDHKLLQGTHNYFADFYRSVRIWHEFRKGFKALSRVNHCITIFGSARFKEDNPYYKLAYDTACLLGKEGYHIMTGGGPGIMEAANKGAQDVGALSVGSTIKLPSEQKPNPYQDISVNFDYFFVRKVMLLKYSRAFILFPGGFGTMDEVFEVANLIKTDKICNFPMIAMGSDYWHELRPFIEKTMLSMGTISENDLDFMKITDDPQEALDIIKLHAIGERI